MDWFIYDNGLIDKIFIARAKENPNDTLINSTGTVSHNSTGTVCYRNLNMNGVFHYSTEMLVYVWMRP